MEDWWVRPTARPWSVLCCCSERELYESGQQHATLWPDPWKRTSPRLWQEPFSLSSWHAAYLVDYWTAVGKHHAADAHRATPDAVIRLKLLCVELAILATLVPVHRSYGVVASHPSIFGELCGKVCQKGIL